MVRFHEAWDWIWLKDQSQPTYKALLIHCQLLNPQCKQYQKDKENGWAELTSLSTVTSLASSIHQDAIMTFPKCSNCGYSQHQASAQLMTKSAPTVVARTAKLPCVDKTEDPITTPMTVEPDHPDNQADPPERERERERAGPDTTDMATGTDPAAPWQVLQPFPDLKPFPLPFQQIS